MKKIIITSFKLFALLACFSQAQALTLNVKSGKVAAQPIAVVPFQNNTGSNKIDYIVSVDLKQSGVFAPVSPKSYTQRPVSEDQINFDNWSSKNIPYVVIGKQSANSITFSIADTFKRKILGPYTVKSSPNSRMGAHRVADGILKQLTGIRGAFATRLTYVLESGNGKHRKYRLMVSDSDGKSAKTLLTSKKPIVSPRFSPDGSKLAYVTYEGRVPEIVTHDVMSGRRGFVSKDQGVSAPAWSPKGDRIAFVSSKQGNSEIYIKNLGSGAVTRVTNHKAIDTEPVFSPNGDSMYFTSDRSGRPHLYRINLRNGSVKKVTDAGSENAGADVSPDGKKLAIASNRGGQYRIGTINLANGKFSSVSRGALDETPRFSPNGQMLIYTALKGGRQVLSIVNVDGSGENVLSSPNQIRDPDWSRFVD